MFYSINAPSVSCETPTRDGVPSWGVPLPLDKYRMALNEQGVTAIPTEGGAIWTRFESAALVRWPIFRTASVSRDEARQVLRQGRAGLASFLLEPDGDEHQANACVYMCRHRSYSVEDLPSEVRRHVRRAHRSLRIGPVDWKTLLDKGLRAYCDTRTRVGLSDGTTAGFRRRFETYSSFPGHYAVGAWRDETLVAYMTLIVIDDWVAIEGSFSITDELDHRPNNGLAHYVLDHFLNKEGMKVVCYGTSSIQEDAHKSGLHAYKTRIGFKAEPVHRAFILHPFLEPLANRIVLWSMKTALRFRPGDRRLLKAIGALNYALTPGQARSLHRGEIA